MKTTHLALAACLLAVALRPADATELRLGWTTTPAPLPDRPGLVVYHEGESLRVLAAPALVDAGDARIHPFALDDGEELYVYWVADATLAEFLPPSRILARRGHEVLVATRSGPPRLTEAAIAQLPGLRQPVHVPRQALVPTAPLPDARTVPGWSDEPLVRDMLDRLSTAAYESSWQRLEDFRTRYTFTRENGAAGRWLLEQFQAMGLDAEFHTYEQRGERQNVVATLPGTVAPSRSVYLTAHFDATSPTPDFCAPGADDNASGTAAVLEAARVMSRYQFAYTIRFVCFNGEEQGLVGSRAFASDIADAGESVIGAFNLDMIAYPGRDAAPPDLVLYANEASAPLARTMADACDTYLPGRLEPIVRLQSIGASDHASFWAQGYRALLAIEAEAWGTDFNPWYHTCGDRASRASLDYATDCTKAALAAAALTALPQAYAGPVLQVARLAVDDDDMAPSQGNGDSMVNPGETIELWLTAANAGIGNAAGVSATLSSTNPHVDVLTSQAAWPDLAPGAEAISQTPFTFAINAEALDGEDLALMLDFDGVLHGLDVDLSVAAPRLTYHGHHLDDAVTGNGNGVLEGGEIVELHLRLENGGGQAAADVVARLRNTTARVTPLQGSASAAVIPAGERVTLVPALRVQVAEDVELAEVITLELLTEHGAGEELALSFKIKAGTHFFDDAEAGGAWSLASVDDDASGGRWQRVAPRGTWWQELPCQPDGDVSTNGSQCFVTGQGTAGGPADEADVDGGTTTLTSPLFDLSALVEPRVTYWRWFISTGEPDGDDAWVAQVSADGGISWIELERSSTSTPSWERRSFPLAVDARAQVQFRFLATDGGDDSIVEAALDDFELSGTPGTPPSTVVRAVPALRAAAPNPVSTTTLIRYVLPQATAVELAIYRTDGRLVRSLASGVIAAGPHDVVWDGTGDAHQPLATGIYFYRLQAGNHVSTRKLVLLR